MAGVVRFSLLGPVRARRGEREVTPASPRGRAVLAALLLREGRWVPAEELIDAAWGASPPAAARTALHGQIGRLGRALGESGAGCPLIRGVGGGYVLEASGGALDLRTFRELVAAAERLRGAGRAAQAAAVLRAALALWRGRPLDDLTGDWAEHRRALLSAQRLTAVEARISAELAAGAGPDADPATGRVVAELRWLVAEHPLDERFPELLMTVLGRAGRTAEALEVYHRAQRVLAAELGVDPGPALRRIRQQMPAVPTPPAPRAPLPELPVPRQLPRGQPYFCGRRAELAETERAVRAAPAAVVAVQGPAGIGKSAFALALAHRLAPGYPDGQLYAALGASDRTGDGAAEPHRVLGSFLRALGTAPGAIPDEPQARSALFRSVLAGRRLLLLLDDVRDARDVRALLPGTAGCVVVATGRGGLGGLVVREGALRPALGPLTAAESRELLELRIGARAAAEPDVVAALAAHCAGVPLTLSRVAARAVLRARFPLAGILGELRDGTLASAVPPE